MRIEAYVSATDRDYFLCDCHTPYHGILIEYDSDIEGFVVSYVSTKSGRFWHRVKYALRHVFRSEALVEADIILNHAEADRVVRFLDAKRTAAS